MATTPRAGAWSRWITRVIGGPAPSPVAAQNGRIAGETIHDEPTPDGQAVRELEKDAKLAERDVQHRVAELKSLTTRIADAKSQGARRDLQ
jgi:hypothetical protein